jgi:TonB family protein
MAESTGHGPERLNVSAGHLSVHLEGEHPPEVPFNFDWQRKRTGWSMAVSFGINSILLAAALILPTFFPHRTTINAFLPDNPNEHIVWLAEPGPGGGGGGGGNKMKDPPRVAELPGKEKITVPVEKPPAPIPKPPQKEPELVAQLNIPAVTLGASVESLPGVIASQPGLPSASQGSGSGGGAGTGTGSGIGPGSGSGLGPGTGGGTGGGAYRPGNGVTIPELLHQEKPKYTAEAMRAKVQGSVEVECVVRPDGSPGDCRIRRSLDPTFGLDEEAIRAARLWRFKPGTRFGQPVPVIITIELSFTLR